MPEPQRVPLTPDQVDLETSLTDVIRVPSYPSVQWIADEFEETIARLGIPVERTAEDREVVVRYRCSIEQALRLGYDRRHPVELLEALLREYPWLAPDRGRLRQRLHALRSEHERRQPGRRTAPAPPRKPDGGAGGDAPTGGGEGATEATGESRRTR